MRSAWMVVALAVVAGCGSATATDGSGMLGGGGRQVPSAQRQVFDADSSCDGGCDAGVLAHAGTFASGVHFVDLGSVQNGVRAYLHSNVLSGGGTVQFVFSDDCSTWTSFDPLTELTGTGVPLAPSFTLMGFDAPSARCVGVRNTSQMDATLLLWAIGV